MWLEDYLPTQVAQPCIGHGKGEITLEQAGNHPAGPGVFFQADRRVAVGHADQTVDPNHAGKGPVDPGSKCDRYHKKHQGPDI